ncbi:MFS transporter [Aerosticca soli]|uniref:Niacin transporter NiaP n=1 Tax=Aerosticca soli TaxID=2010829 RepID=A0A2Z6E371_9GAMM|nr:MFS transporter [Aerosticca soli]MDI3262127.1 MFS transporter [Fulvimonas sp.]BBD79407.1 niacin transporter NiaP [Aerosticca soli]
MEPRAAAIESAPAPAAGVSVGEVFADFPFTREHVKSCLALFFVFVIDAWESMIIVYASASLRADFALSPLALGNLIGAIFVGMALGALVWGRIGNWIGRKRCLMWSMGCYGALSLLSAFAPDYAALYALRLLAGFAAAGMMVVTFPYFEELLPVRVRGPASVFLATGWPIGMLCALAVSVLWAGHGWRWIIGVSSLAALWLLVVGALVPESPYWLAGAGRGEAARAVLQRLAAGRARLPDAPLYVEPVRHVRLREVLHGTLGRITALQCLLNFAFAWGYWGLQTWLPTLLEQRGLSLPESYGFIVLSALWMIPGYVSAAWLTHRYGRRSVMVAYVGLATVAGFVFAGAHNLPMLYAGNFAMVFFSQGAWGVWDTWMGEFYPTASRTLGYGLGTLAQRLANIAAPSAIGAMVAAGAGFGTITAFINVFLLSTLCMAWLLPETEGHRLD